MGARIAHWQGSVADHRTKPFTLTSAMSSNRTTTNHHNVYIDMHSECRRDRVPRTCSRPFDRGARSTEPSALVVMCNKLGNHRPRGWERIVAPVFAPRRQSRRDSRLRLPFALVGDHRLDLTSKRDSLFCDRSHRRVSVGARTKFAAIS